MLLRAKIEGKVAFLLHLAVVQLVDSIAQLLALLPVVEVKSTLAFIAAIESLHCRF